MQSKVMGDFPYTLFHWQVPMKFFYPKYLSFCLSLFFLKNIFLKILHMSDDGTEIDSKDNIHPSFVII